MDPYENMDFGLGSVGMPSYEEYPALQGGGIVEGQGDGVGILARIAEHGDEVVTPLNELKERIIDPIITKTMTMMPAMQNMGGGGGMAAPSMPIVVSAPNNSQIINSSTTIGMPMSASNKDFSRHIDLNR
jgi:hypothetical protein